MNLKCFTQPEILQQIGSRRLEKLFHAFRDDLKTEHAVLPTAESQNGSYFDSLAATLATHAKLPDRLQKTLLTLETAASLEKRPLLDSAIQRPLSSVSLNNECSLDCALELWFQAPEELTQFQSVEVVPGSQPPAVTETPAHQSTDQRTEIPEHRNTEAPSTEAPTSDLRPPPSDLQSPNSELLSSPTWRIRPCCQESSLCKRLICKGAPFEKGSKVAVVKTYPIPKVGFLCIIQRHHVFALHHAKEKRQGASLLESRRKQALWRKQDRAAPRSLPG